MEHHLRYFSAAVMAVFLVTAGYAQGSAPCPSEITFGIHDLWKAATEAEL